MNIIIIISVFACNALALNFIVGEKYKLAGGLTIASMCLMVAMAYQLNLIKPIFWVLVTIAVAALSLMYYISKKKKEKEYNSTIVGNYKEIESEDNN